MTMVKNLLRNVMSVVNRLCVVLIVALLSSGKVIANNECNDVDKIVNLIETQEESIESGPGVYSNFNNKEEKFYGYTFSYNFLFNFGKTTKDGVMIYDIYNDKYYLYGSIVKEHSGYIYLQSGQSKTDYYSFSKNMPKDYNFLLEFENCKVKQLIIKSN